MPAKNSLTSSQMFFTLAPCPTYFIPFTQAASSPCETICGIRWSGRRAVKRLLLFCLPNSAGLKGFQDKKIPSEINPGNAADLRPGPWWSLFWDFSRQFQEYPLFNLLTDSDGIPLINTTGKVGTLRPC
jgi:hypothetical protein